ncbi:MAG: PmoA family protein [Fimbriimonadaceae bacterium]|nr:PmoA family protein [Fimbriimonadaceae bacterium]
MPICRYEPRRLQIVDHRGQPLLVQHAPGGGRPFIHPLAPPDGRGCLTEVMPAHHLWQMGLYTGLHGVNGVDFWTAGLSSAGLEHDGTFHPEPLSTPQVSGDSVAWTVICGWRAPSGQLLLVERQHWCWQPRGAQTHLDLRWTLSAACDVSFDQCSYGGLFLRPPYRDGLPAVAVDSAGRDRAAAEQQRSRWVAVALPLDGRDDLAGVAILDHPSNPAHPVPWRVDAQYGVSPSRCIAGGWSLARGSAVTERYRLVLFAGSPQPASLAETWQDWATA